MTTEEKVYPVIVNMAAFNTGYGAFFTGSRKPYTVTPALQEDLNRFSKAIVANKPTTKIVDKFKEMGLHAIAVVTGNRVSARLEQTTEAENPYKPGTYAAKEWQRGYNAAYFKNIERNKHARSSRPVSGARSGPKYGSRNTGPRKSR